MNKSIESLNTLLTTMSNIGKFAILSNSDKQLAKSVYNELNNIVKYKNVKIVLFDENNRFKFTETNRLADKELSKKLIRKKMIPECIKHIKKHIGDTIISNYSEICENCPMFLFDKKDIIKIIPIVYKKLIYGCLSISFNKKELISKRENDFLLNIANHIALAINSIHLKNENMKSMANYKTIFETTSAPTILIEENSIISHANNKFAEITGFSVKEIEGKMKWTEFVVKEDLERMLSHHKQRRKPKSNEPTTYEFRFKKRNGEIRNILLNIDMIPGTKKSIASLMDLTEIKKMQHELFEREKQYRTIVEESNDTIIIYKGKRILFVNNMGIKLSGYSRKELYKMNLLEMFTAESQEKMKSIIIRRMKGELIPHHYETEITTKSGEVRIVSISGRLVKYINEDAVLIVASDITDKKKMEKQFIENDKMESIAVLAGGIAHDFNNLLTGIIGNLSLMNLADNIDEIRKIIVKTEKAADRAIKLTNQLLTFSSGGAPVKQEISVYNVLKESIEFSLHGSKIKCEFDENIEINNINADENQIAQVINNIVINAIQSMPNGGILKVKAGNKTIKKSSHLIIEPGEYIYISIKDTGTGIPKNIIKKIFEPFFTTKQTGSGLGLATAYSIIKNHNGYIDIKSEIGKGAEFIIYLPSIPGKSICSQNIKTYIEKGTGRVLILDDEKMIREVAGEMLEKIGYDVEVSDNSAQAIELYSQSMKDNNKFDVVILDLTLPGDIGGEEVIKELIKIDPEIKAIVSSGYSNDPVMSNFKEYGFKAVVPKPYRINDLSAALKQLLNN